MGVARFVGAIAFKRAVNKDKVWSYKRLGLLPEGTLGREYWKHLTEVGFGFPGEPGGIADSVAYHDVGHVLAAHDTTPAGEIQQGSFQGGNRREDGFFSFSSSFCSSIMASRSRRQRRLRSATSTPRKCCGRSIAARDAMWISRTSGISGR
jgi:ubiquinone biosynthesis protein Coq4